MFSKISLQKVFYIIKHKEHLQINMFSVWDRTGSNGCWRDFSARSSRRSLAWLTQGQEEVSHHKQVSERSRGRGRGVQGKHFIFPWETFYTAKLEIYAGEQLDNPFELSNKVVDINDRMVEPIISTGRNGMFHNWFMSVPMT